MSFEPFNKTAEQETIKALDASYDGLRRLSPKSGAYINEGFPFEKNFQQVFWGSNYDRLLSIKRKIDPWDVLWCSPCVGNERLAEKEDGRLCKSWK